MGGYYFPKIQGEIFGLKTGLLTDLIVCEHTCSINYPKKKEQWLLGYDIGFNKGQDIRNYIKENSKEENFEMNINAALFLQKQIPNYGNFKNELDEYLKNIDKWDKSKIELTTILNANQLLLEEKLQRSLNLISCYYKNNYRLATQMKFYLLENQLSKIRVAKQKQEIDSRSYLIQKTEIQSKFKNWLNEEQLQ